MPVTIIKNGEPLSHKRRGKKRPNFQWESLRETFITKNLHPKDGIKYTLGDLAREYNVNYNMVRIRASNEKWSDQLSKALKDRDTEVRKQVIAHRSEVARGAQSDEINSEVSVRQRQASIARMLYSKAAARLKDVNPKKLTIREAIELARLGLLEERKALGLPDKHEVIIEEREGDYLSIGRTKEILGKVIEMAEISEGSYQEVGDGA